LQCELVEPPKGNLQYQHYFCAQEQGNAEQLKVNEPKRVALYKAVAAVTRAYGNLANEMTAAGYTEDEAAVIKAEIAHYADVRAEVKLGAGENVDCKQHEAGMRHLLDTYISATPSEVVSDFQDAGLIQLIAVLGSGAIDKLPERIKKDPEAVAETIANNIRKVMTDEHATNPKYYDKMSELLDAILEERRKGALNYKDYLAKLLEQATKLGKGESDTQYPSWADNGARRALIDFFHPQIEIAVEIDTTIRHTKPDSWVGHPLRERKVKLALARSLPADFDRLDELSTW
jgi:type I restriction enzyme R subunit